VQNELLDGFRLQELRIEPLTGFVRRNDQESPAVEKH
jgi:hypothetical protein